MAGELGYLAFLGAFITTLAWTLTGFASILRADRLLQTTIPAFSYAVLFCMLVSFAGLGAAFFNNEFAYSYIAAHSNSMLPWYYRLSAVWGGHEGSLLLWATIMAGWTAAVAFFSGQQSPLMRARVLTILGTILLSILAFILFTSSPFATTLPMLPVDGADLNPLLQDPGLIFHPPTLYMGYVGMAVPFAFCMAALWGGKMDSAWIRWMRPWTLLAWVFLTLGIALGSYWAYYELGWGGWWFWDPVENASFMPWLAATALIHSLSVSEKRGVFKAWTVFLAILAFALSLLGTFLVRSGVLTSVHAFAADPQRGLFVLVILVITIGASLAMFAWKGWQLTAESAYTLRSRESVLVLNNILLVTATLVVLLGTLYPLISSALGLGDISVGPPYFNALFVPLTWLVLALMGVGPVMRWKKQGHGLLKPGMIIGLSSLLLAGGFTWLLAGGPVISVLVTLFLCNWVAGWMLFDLVAKTRHKSGFVARLHALQQQPTSYWAMQVAHAGVLLAAIGVSLTTTLDTEKDIVLKAGQTVQVRDYAVTLRQLSHYRAKNYDSTRATIHLVTPAGNPLVLHPEKRMYVVQNRPMTEAAIDGGLLRDIYVSLGEPVASAPGTEAWAVRVYIKPFVRFIWLGALVMAIGGIMVLLDKRYRVVFRHRPHTFGSTGADTGKTPVSALPVQAMVEGES